MGCEHGNLKAFRESDLYKTETEMKVLFDEFHDMLDKIEGWELYQSHSLVQNDIKLYHNTEGSRLNMMACFLIPWSIEEASTLFFEKESVPQWCKLPSGASLEVEH